MSVAPASVVETGLPGVLVVERPTHADERGFFREIERRHDLEQTVNHRIIDAQWNHSRSARRVLRGIHVATWNKCIYVVRGNAQVVIVDLRPESPTFGAHESLIVGEQRRAAVFVPAGCGNSYLALSGSVDFMYSVDAEWYPNGEFGIAWDDPDLRIKWKVRQPFLSEKDRRNPTLREVFPARFP
jgi:dTDP-4-dehydrorhamnose 3,5-epimerase